MVLQAGWQEELNDMDTQKPQLTPEVIDAISDELEYQSTLAGTPRADTTDHGLAGKILTLEELAALARKAWYGSGDKTEALDIVRKIAATACRAMILYGCQKRNQVWRDVAKHNREGMTGQTTRQPILG